MKTYQKPSKCIEIRLADSRGILEDGPLISIVEKFACRSDVWQRAINHFLNQCRNLNLNINNFAVIVSRSKIGEKFISDYKVS